MKTFKSLFLLKLGKHLFLVKIEERREGRETTGRKKEAILMTTDSKTRNPWWGFQITIVPKKDFSECAMWFNAFLKIYLAKNLM